MKTWIFGLFVLLLMAGCQTDEVSRPLSWREQQAYTSQMRDPRIYGLGIYQTPRGVEYRGGGRLHPNQAEALDMALEKPFRPVVMLSGSFGREWPVLLDPVSISSWLNFDLAKAAGAHPVGEREPTLVRSSVDDEVVSCLSLAPFLRFNQLHVERPLVYVRLAEGPLGSLGRGIKDPSPDGVIGWNILKKFSLVQFNYTAGQVLIATDQPYTPDPSRLIADVPLVVHAGVCVIRGQVEGKDTLVFIDPAGDFSLSGAARISIGEGLELSSPAPDISAGSVRIGAQALQNYLITICPQDGVVYFERPLAEE